MPRDPKLSPGPSPVTGAPALVRLAAIGMVMLGAATAFAYTGGWLSPDRLTQGRMIDRFEAVNGPHPGFRRNHAKGVCIAGFFESNGKAVRLSKAAIFAPGRVPVIGRFALAGGRPHAADSGRSVRSLALRFSLPGGEEWRTGMNGLPVFGVNTPEGFYEQSAAGQPDPATGKPDSAKMKAFLDNHPETVRAVGLITSQVSSTSFRNTVYRSLDAFRFIDAAGASVPVRWSMAPVQPFVAEAAAQAGQRDKNGLFDDLIGQIGDHPLQWHLMITLSQPEDPTNDATIRWPDGREQVDAGTLTIDHIEGEATGSCRDTNFDPLVLPSGIAPSDDPLLSARSSAYARSVTRRDGEAKEPSAVKTADTREGEHS